MSHRRESRPNLFARVWSNVIASGRRKAASVARPRVRLQLEYLEDRVVPAVIDVTTLADGTGAGTLRSAIAQADANDAVGDTNNTINLTVAGTYNIGQLGLGALAIFNNATATQSGLSLTIQNTSAGNVAISGNNANRVFDINPTNVIANNNAVLGAVTINGVTIENGLASDASTPDGPNASGGGIRDQGPVDLTLNNDVIANSSATADGGGVSMENTTSTKWALTLNNTTIVNNHAGDAGGGIDEDGTGKVFINNSTIADNTTLNQGGGVWLDAINNGTAALNVTNSTVSGNTAGVVGGGIGQAGSSTVTITSSTIAHNFTTGFGGGFGDENNLGSLIVQNSLFLDNSAAGNGGGIQEGGPNTTITDSEIKGNAAGINGSMSIGGNPATGSGGGLFIDGGALTLTSSTIANNTAPINGGGIELQTTAASTIINTTIVGNTALNSGGTGNGGGIDDAATGAVALVDDTITNNFAVFGGGFFYLPGSPAGSSITFQNTIIAQNFVTATAPDVSFNIAPTNSVDLGGNLIGIGNPAFFTAATTQQGTAANPLNPQVTGLSNNGGPLVGATDNQITLETEALLPGSPAIGKGVANGAPTVDERGAPRLNTIDVGAFQFENVSLQLNIGTQPTLPIGTSETASVTVTNTSGNPLPADNSKLTVTASGGLDIGGTQTFTVGPLAAGQSQTFSFNATGIALGNQTITATVTSPDANPATVSTNTTVNVVQNTTPTPTTANTNPVGGLTLFGFGFGPTGLDVFEVDSRGDVFAQAFSFTGLTGAPIFLSAAPQFSGLHPSDGALLAFLHSGNQQFLVDVFNPFTPSVLSALIAAIHS